MAERRVKRIRLVVKKRGKEKAKALRRQGLVPAIVYGPKIEPIQVVLPLNEAENAWLEAGTSHLIDLQIEGEKEPRKVLIYEVQTDPLTDKIIHLDFYAVRMDQPIRAEVPLEFVGEAPAVKEKGGILLIEKDFVEIECLPKDLPEEIKVDLSTLREFHDAIKIGDLDLPEGIELTEEKEIVLATVQPPRSEEELKELEEAPVEDVEAVEVEEKGKEEEEEGEQKEEKGAEKPSSEGEEGKQSGESKEK
ncbi:50S ribosomal protein L25 [bacterium]|nr:50S ribosomal protein L25 [bacterium]